METWLSENIGQIIRLFANGLINFIINPIIEQIGNFFYIIIDYLPNFSPDRILDKDQFGSELIGWICWFLPLNAMLTGMGILVVSWTAYFGVAPILRWFKFVK